MASTSRLEAPDPIDVHVGRQIRARRTLIGWSQDRLAGHLGVSFQQLQKYESGSNRISASMMFRAAQALSVPTSYFFEGLDGSERDAEDPEIARTALKIASDLRRLPGADVRRSLMMLISQLAERP